MSVSGSIPPPGGGRPPFGRQTSNTSSEGMELVRCATCSICGANLLCPSLHGNGSKVGCLRDCRHIYHLGCITEWLRTHQGCPKCRIPAAAAQAKHLNPVEVLESVRVPQEQRVRLAEANIRVLEKRLRITEYQSSVQKRHTAILKKKEEIERERGITEFITASMIPPVVLADIIRRIPNLEHLQPGPANPRRGSVRQENLHDADMDADTDDSDDTLERF